MRSIPVLLVLASLASAQTFPRIGNLWGAGPVVGEVDKWAKWDLLVVGGGSPGEWRAFTPEARRRNPRIRLFTTAPLMNIGAPEATPWMKPEWYLRRPTGEPVRWWADQVYAPNLFVDACLDALEAQTETPYGVLLDEGCLDGVFFDSVVPGLSWYGAVDTNGDAVADVPSEVDARWTARQNLFFDRLRARHPRMMILANDVSMDHAPHANGRLFEGAPLLDQVFSGSRPVSDAVRSLTGWTHGSVQPAATFALMTQPTGWQGWRVGKGAQVTTPGEQDRARRDFRRMRLGLCTTLMSDAYYAYDFGTVWYGLPWRYAEYDAPLGKALGPGREVFDAPPIVLLDWQGGQPLDAFTLDRSCHATPEGIVGSVPERDAPWRRLFGTNSRVLPFEPGKAYRIRAAVTLLRPPGQTLQFNLRTPTGGWQNHDKGVALHAAGGGPKMDLDVTVVPDDFPDYAAEWHLLGGGEVRLDSLRIELIRQAYWVREFEGGIVLVNPLPGPIVVRLPNPGRRLVSDEVPREIIEMDDHEPGFACTGAWELRSGENHYAGNGFRLARKPGDTARWSFAIPAADRYTVFAAIPGGKDLTDAAEYTLTTPGGALAATVSQRPCDGGWVRLFDADLPAGAACALTLTSAGVGLTVADAIRIESAARYHDGATVSEVTLPARDGILLLSGSPHPTGSARGR